MTDLRQPLVDEKNSIAAKIEKIKATAREKISPLQQRIGLLDHMIAAHDAQIGGAPTAPPAPVPPAPVVAAPAPVVAAPAAPVPPAPPVAPVAAPAPPVAAAPVAPAAAQPSLLDGNGATVPAGAKNRKLFGKSLAPKPSDPVATPAATAAAAPVAPAAAAPVAKTGVIEEDFL